MDFSKVILEFELIAVAPEQPEGSPCTELFVSDKINEKIDRNVVGTLREKMSGNTEMRERYLATNNYSTPRRF